MIKTLEEKATEVRARWDELHKPKTKPKTDSTLLSDLEKLLKPAAIPDWNKYTAVSDRVFGDYIKDVNTSDGLNNLKRPIIWVGKVAVGEDRRYANWWNSVEPNGVVVAYFGPQAKERALEYARQITQYYK